MPLKNKLIRVLTKYSISLTLRTKLYLLLGVVLLGLVFIGLKGWHLHNNVRIGSDAYKSIMNYQSALEQIAYLKSDFNQIRSEYLSVAEENNPEIRNQRLAFIGSLNGNVDETFERIKKIIPEKLLKPLDESRNEWIVFNDNMSSKIIPVLLSGDKSSAIERLQSIQKYRYISFVKNLDALIVLINQSKDQEEHAVDEMISDRIRGMQYLTLLAVFVIFVIVVLVVYEMKTDKERAEQVLDVSEAILVAFEDDFKVTLLNRKGQDILGVTENELLKKNWLENCVYPKDIPAVEAVIGNLKSGDMGRSVYHESHVVTRSGDVRFIGWHITVMKDAAGHDIGFLCSGEDMTEKRNTIQELSKSNEDIERFIYIVSHDLRTPLVTIKTFLGYLEQDMAACNVQRVAKDMEFLNSASNRMEEQLNGLLALSRVDHMKPACAEITFREIMGGTLSAVAGQIAKGHVDVRVNEADIMFIGESKRLMQIWQNLMDNALKYMGNQAMPVIEVGVDESGDDKVFYIRDNGIGIAPEYRKLVFGLFERLDSQSDGVGMGLTIVKRIVEKYGGSIDVGIGINDQGCCFRFTLPEAVQPAHNQQKPNLKSR